MDDGQILFGKKTVCFPGLPQQTGRLLLDKRLLHIDLKLLLI
jgi:hypothetical protein